MIKIINKPYYTYWSNFINFRHLQTEEKIYWNRYFEDLADMKEIYTLLPS